MSSSRSKTNLLTRTELVEIANHRAGSDKFDSWQFGYMATTVIIGSVILNPDDVVLFDARTDTVCRVWSPLIDVRTFIAPLSHVAVDDDGDAEDLIGD